MATDDFAIIVGVDRYPGISDLKGAENDARAFAAWVASQGVPAERTKLILSSGFPRAADVLEAHPHDREIVNEFSRLFLASRDQIKSGKPPRIGRRLYIFFAGHGFVPDWQAQITALLTANASEDDPVHIAGRLHQRVMIEQGIFDEVLLFMDCCSTAGRQYPLTYPTFFQVKNLTAVNNPRWLAAIASPLALKTREKTRDREGRAQGVFTLTLLDALTGKAGARVTNAVLARYLRENMRGYLDLADLADDTVSKYPDVKTGDGTFDVVVLDGVDGVAVTIAFGAEHIGESVTLTFGDQTIATTVAGAEPWRVSVPKPALYVLTVGTYASVLDATRGDADVRV